MYMVTGCAGFIGSSLTERLLHDGHSVIGIDNFDPYYPIDMKKTNIKNLLRNKNFKFLNASILDKNSIKDEIKDVDIIFHEAAIAGVRNSMKFPSKYFEINVKGTTNILELAIRNVKKIVFGSSSSVYGEVKKEELPVNEERNPNPFSPYALSKFQGEKICKMFTDLYGLDITSLRYFTVYGPRQRPDEAFTKFLTRIIRNKTIEIYGDGTQTRDFTFIEDVVDATILATKKGSDLYNIGSGKSIELNEIIKIMKEVTSKNPKTINIEKQSGDVPHTWADITKAKEKLGYIPKIGIGDGIKKHFEWCKKHENITFSF